jgi:hypothetical protein
MQTKSISRFIAVFVAGVACLASFAFAGVAAPAAQAKAPASNAIKVEIDGKTMKIASKRDLAKVDKSLAGNAKLRKNALPAVAFTVYAAARAIMIKCSIGAARAGVNTVFHYAWHYHRLPSGGELWNGTRGGCFVLRYF